VQAKSQRETVAYVADVLRSDVPAAMQIFSGAINTPAFKPA
jgi:predicted Zn-dependent peptidase